MNHTILQEGKVIGRYYYDGVNVGFISFFPKIDVNTHTVGLKKQIGGGVGVAAHSYSWIFHSMENKASPLVKY